MTPLQTSRTIPLRRRFVFASCLIGLGAVAGAILAEAAIRASGIAVADDPYIHMGLVAPFFDEVEVDGVPSYRIAHREVYRERNVVFSREKAPRTFRVFALGGSANAGWPHPPTEIYTAYLQEALARAYPTRRIEIINLGAHAYAAYRVRLILDQVIALDPDLVVIYSGNNEFIEQRRYRTSTRWDDSLRRAAETSKLYRLIRGSRTLFPSDVVDAEGRGGVAFEQWSKIERVVLDLRKDPEQFRALQDHYRHTISSMVGRAAEYGVPVFLMTVPVNLRDWQPNVSLETAAGTARERWREAYRSGRAAHLQGRSGDAVRQLELAATLDPDHAGTRFALAGALEAEGHLGQSYDMFSLARDLDHNPFRALSIFNETIRDIASVNANASLLDAERAFRSASERAAPGFDYFLDYVHPSVEGNMLLARLLFDAIVEQALIDATPPVSTFSEWAQDRTARMPYEDAADHSMQVTLVLLSMMMHQYDVALDKARAIVENPDALASLAADDASFVRGAFVVLPDVVAAEREEVQRTGAFSADRRRAAQERLTAFYREHWEGYEAFQQEMGETATQ